MNKKLTILLMIVIIISSTGSILAMDPVTEDSWIGAYFLKNHLLNENEKINPFIDIRRANTNQSDLSSNFKLIIVNSILANELQIIKAMQQRNVDYDEIYKLEYLIDNYEIDQEILSIELSLMLKLKDEIINTFENNIKSENKKSVYNFYHIFLYKTESFSVSGINSDNNGIYKEKFKSNQNELKESKVNTDYFNQLIPLSAAEVLEFRDSPLVTINSYNISDEDRQKVKKELGNVNFYNNFQIQINKFAVTYQIIEDIYLELLKLDKNEDAELLNKVKESKYYQMNIETLFDKLREVR